MVWSKDFTGNSRQLLSVMPIPPMDECTTVSATGNQNSNEGRYEMYVPWDSIGNHKAFTRRVIKHWVKPSNYRPSWLCNSTQVHLTYHLTSPFRERHSPHVRMTLSDMIPRKSCYSLCMIVHSESLNIRTNTLFSTSMAELPLYSSIDSNQLIWTQSLPLQSLLTTTTNVTFHSPPRPNDSPTRVTRSGHHVHWPECLNM